MKKAGILLILILLFTVCLVTGFKITNPFLTNQTSPTRNNDPNSRQQNLLLIHVNNLKSQKPDLVSVWVLFLYYSDATPSMIFSPVYPGSKISKQASIYKEQFALSPDGSVPGPLIKLLQQDLNITIDGYVLVDDFASSVFSKIFQTDPPSPEPYKVLPTDEAKMLTNLCDFIKTDAGRRTPLPWDQVLPDHFRTDLNFSSFMANWLKLTQAPSAPHCEMIKK